MRLSRHHALAALALAALPVAVAPRAAAAQDSAATVPVRRTHTVKRGDTLWDLSRSYLGDPFRWPAIYRLNTTVVENPHWIYPGERLALPDALVAVAPASEPEASSVFTQTAAQPSAASDHLAPVGRGTFAAVRPGEAEAAPFLEREGGPVASVGQLTQPAALTNIRSHLGDNALLLHDEVYLTPASGRQMAVGERYVTYALGARLEKLGQVVVPTGVVEVERAEVGEMARARLVRQFGRVIAGQRLLPASSPTGGAGQAPSAVRDSVSATVLWIPNESVLPSVQTYVVLDATERQGTRVGDQFTLVKPRETPRPGALAVPEVEIAVAQVVRVTPYGATALVLSQREPAIRRGTRARVTAKMP
jgi:hypothetical protein